jgi:hypothetical protein
MGQKSDRDRAFGKTKRGTHLWCLHCERTYEHGKWRDEDGLQMCPYVGCSGDAVIDAWEWDKVRENHSDYPAIPVFGTRYPLYK